MPPYFRQSFASRQPSPYSSGGFLSVPRWRHYWLGGNTSQADIRTEPWGGSVTPRATPSATQTNCFKKRKKTATHLPQPAGFGLFPVHTLDTL